MIALTEVRDNVGCTEVVSLEGQQCWLVTLNVWDA